MAEIAASGGPRPAPRSRATLAVARTGGALVVLALVLCAQPPAGQADGRADYVRNAQNANGGWGLDPRQASSHLGTGWAALGLAAAGRNPQDVRRSGRSPITYIRRRIRQLTEVGELERTILVVRAAGLSPRRFGGRDLVSALLRNRRRDGSFAGFVSYSSFGVMALRASGLPRSASSIRNALEWLRRHQGPDGGFSLTGRGGLRTADDTGYVLQALAAGGWRRSSAARRAVAFLARRQNRDGGFPFYSGGRSNAQSTAYAVQGLVAVGRDPDRLRRGGATPLQFLRSLTARDGRVRYSRRSGQTSVWVTAQALAALARRPLPIAPVPRRRTSAGRGARQGHIELVPSTEAAKPDGERRPSSGAADRSAREGRAKRRAGTRSSHRLARAGAARPTGGPPPVFPGADARGWGVGGWSVAAAGVAALLALAGWAHRRSREGADDGPP